MTDPDSAPETDPDTGTDPHLERALRIAEALVFASTDPVPASRLDELLAEDFSTTGTSATGAPPFAAAHILAILTSRCEGRGVHLHEVAGGWMFRTAADLGPLLARVVEKPRRLPRSAMETLSVIAYHQPCTRAEIEERRGVALAQSTLEALIEAGLVRPAGQRETPGRPNLWATTPEFLVRFGLASLAALPKRDELLAEMPAIPDPRPISDPSPISDPRPEITGSPDAHPNSAGPDGVLHARSPVREDPEEDACSISTGPSSH